MGNEQDDNKTRVLINSTKRHGTEFILRQAGSNTKYSIIQPGESLEFDSTEEFLEFLGLSSEPGLKKDKSSVLDQKTMIEAKKEADDYDYGKRRVEQLKGAQRG